jgi:hypothetical protein
MDISRNSIGKPLETVNPPDCGARIRVEDG